MGCSGELDPCVDELGFDIELIQFNKILKLLAPMKSCFEVALFENRDFHGCFVIISCSSQNGILVKVVLEDLFPIERRKGESKDGRC